MYKVKLVYDAELRMSDFQTYDFKFEKEIVDTIELPFIPFVGLNFFHKGIRIIDVQWDCIEECFYCMATRDDCKRRNFTDGRKDFKNKLGEIVY